MALLSTVDTEAGFEATLVLARAKLARAGEKVVEGARGTRGARGRGC
jgi:hypothetical protein